MFLIVYSLLMLEIKPFLGLKGGDVGMIKPTHIASNGYAVVCCIFSLLISVVAEPSAGRIFIILHYLLSVYKYLSFFTCPNDDSLRLSC